MTILMYVCGMAISTQIVRQLLGDGGIVPTNITFNTTIPAETDDGGLEAVQIVYLTVGALDFGMATVCMLACICLSNSGDEYSNERKAYFKVATEDDVTPLIPDSYEAADHSDDELSNDDYTIIPNSSDQTLIPDNSDATVHTDVQLSIVDKRLQPSSRQGCLLLSLIISFDFIVQVHNFAFNFLLFTYVYEYRHWSMDLGTTIVLANQLTRFIAGTVMVPVSRWVSPTKVMIFNLSMLIIAGVLMAVALVLGDIYTAVGVIFQGVGSSNLKPTTITVVEEMVHVGATLMSVFY